MTKINDTTIFRFNIWFTQDPEYKQERYIAATTEEEAIEKLEIHRRQAIKWGGDDFTYTGPWVDRENVII